MAQGYIYALISSSLQGLVKIGKTVKDPSIRAREISSDTGVPTPFIVAYKVFVSDCDAGELFLHSLLEIKGFRINPKREFFNAPLDVIISSMIELQNKSDFNTQISNNQNNTKLDDSFEFNTEDAFLNELDIEQVEQIPAFVEVLENAEASYYGHGDTIEDFSEALLLYKHATKLGGIEAYTRIGEMYRLGEGCNIDFKLALNYLKEGVSKGNENCYFQMALLFWEADNFDNMNKCFRKYFFSSTFMDNKQIGKVIIEERENNLYNYFFYLNAKNLSFDSDILEIAVNLNDEMNIYFDMKIDTYKNHEYLYNSYKIEKVNFNKYIR